MLVLNLRKYLQKCCSETLRRNKPRKDHFSEHPHTPRCATKPKEKSSHTVPCKDPKCAQLIIAMICRLPGLFNCFKIRQSSAYLPMMSHRSVPTVPPWRNPPHRSRLPPLSFPFSVPGESPELCAPFTRRVTHLPSF